MYFDEDTNIDAANQEVLEKALTAGYGSDASQFTGGRALQPEDLELTLTNVLEVQQNELKLFNSLPRIKTGSTVHQYNRRTGIGEDVYNFVGEGEEAEESDQDIERKLLDMKYIATIGRVTMQAENMKGLVDAYNEEKVAATMRVCRAAEIGCFHGDSSIIDKQFDGILKTIKDSANNTAAEEKNRATLVDLRGYEIGEDVKTGDKDILTGEDLIDFVAESANSKGGDLTKAYFPPVISSQFKRLYREYLRYTTSDTHTGLNELPDLVTAIGSTIKIKGNAGADKMFKVKGLVKPSGFATKRPNAPAKVELSVNASAIKAESKFRDGDAGDYTYVVHAVNSKGVSAGTAASAAATVAVGCSVTITITPSPDGNAATGYIITRSAKDGDKVMEMVSISAKKTEPVTYEDVNADLPGTASIVLLSDRTQEASANLSFVQFMSLSTVPLPRDKAFTHPFGVTLFGALEHKTPEFDALIENVGYRGGLY